MDITTSIKKVKRYPREVEKITATSLKKHEKTAAKWNVQQMEVGLRSDGKSQPQYDPASLNYKRTTPIDEGDTIKLKDTGAFHQSVLSKTKAKKNVIEFTGDYTKGGKTDLEKEFGPIFGLMENNLDKLTDLVFDDLVTGLRVYWK